MGMQQTLCSANPKDDIARGITLIHEGRSLAQEEVIGAAYAKYVHGLQCLLSLDKSLPEVKAMHKKLSQYIDEAEKLKDLIDSGSHGGSCVREGNGSEKTRERHGGHHRKRAHRGEHHGDHGHRIVLRAHQSKCSSRSPGCANTPGQSDNAVDRSRSRDEVCNDAASPSLDEDSSQRPRACLVARKNISSAPSDK